MENGGICPLKLNFYSGFMLNFIYESDIIFERKDMYSLRKADIYE